MSMAFGTMLVGVSLVAAATAQDPSDVVLVFDVSDSILGSDDGTNVEFATALEGIADRVGAIADDLIVGNASVSFVAFGRKATQYPGGCQRLDLHENHAAVTRFEDCLRMTAAEYRAGSDARVTGHINTAGTDHVAALVEAAGLLPDGSGRAAVVFFTDGQHDPPGTRRDDENVIAKVTPAYAGRTPLAILPVGLGASAGAFGSELRAISDAFLRDMAPCDGRASFSWPGVVFPSGEEAGAAVALALQEVTCSFTVAPVPTPAPTPTPEPTPAPPPPGAPLGMRVLAGNESLTIQWLPPTTGTVVDYLVRCRPAAGGEWLASTEGVSTTTRAVIDGLAPGRAYDCQVAASNGVSTGPFAAAPAATVVLGIPEVPGQPRVESLDGAARLSVDPLAGGAPVEQYVYECTGASGQKTIGTGSGPSVLVTGLVNGEAFRCVAYSENLMGRSAPSALSASFTPCGGVFDCNPWAKWAALAVVLSAILVAALLVAWQYRARNRVWVTAQVDGGPNRPLGWGPQLRIGLDLDDAGWFAAQRPLDKGAIRIRYRGKNRFVVHSAAGIRDVHQGDPALVREGTGGAHQLVLRRYRQPPREVPVNAFAPDGSSVKLLGSGLEVGDVGSMSEQGEHVPAASM